MIANTFLFGMPNQWTWIIIILVILLLFGGKKIPELMKGVGGGIKEFKKAVKEENSDSEKDKQKQE